MILLTKVVTSVIVKNNVLSATQAFLCVRQVCDGNVGS